MYTIEKTSYGAKITFSGFIRAEEMSNWVEESEHFLRLMPSKYGVLVDMRGLNPLPADSQKEMEKGQQLYKSKGMQRSVVILDSTITTLQFIRIAKESGIYQWERYIDATKVSNWEEVGIKWLKDGIDPDKS